MTTSDWMALLALVVSVWTLGWTMYRDLMRRPRITIRWWLGNMMSAAEISELKLLITVTNFSDYAVTINGAGGEADDKKGVFFPNVEGERVVAAKSSTVLSLPATVLDRATSVKRFWVSDSLGNSHWYSKKRTAEVYRKYREPASPRALSVPAELAG